MPRRHRVACASVVLWCLTAGAQTPPTVTPAASASQEESSPLRSALDAPLFYQLLVGELELRGGELGNAYQLLLDAAQRTRDDALFKRSIGIALQGRAGEQALAAAQAWRKSRPESREAHLSSVQLALALGRMSEVGKALRGLLAVVPAQERPAMLISLPGLAQNPNQRAPLLETLSPLLDELAREPALRASALSAKARLLALNGRHDDASALSQEVFRLAPRSDDALALALDLLPRQPGVESLITDALAESPDKHLLRVAYARALAGMQRSADAAQQFRLLTERQPQEPSHWFALGSLEIDLRHPAAAEAALTEFLRLTQPAASPEGTASVAAPASAARDSAQLLLARAAELRGDWRTAESRLADIDAASSRADVALRRALLTMRQGRLDAARKQIQAFPGEGAEAKRQRIGMEAQLLREAEQWQTAYRFLETANREHGPRVDWLYEQAMMAEKAGRFADMERLLRDVIAREPSHHHAHNALGYALADRGERLSEARALIAKALAMAPGDPFITDSMGWVEFRLGNLAEAERLLRAAYRARPDAEIAAHLGEVLWHRGERDEARRIWREALQRESGHAALRETLKRLKVTL